MKCSVVIRAYNEETHIGRLLVGLREQNLKPHEIILVDSGSTDRTTDIAEAFGVNIIQIQKEEFSFGRALNIGCQAASGDVLVFASGHVFPVHKTWLQRLVAPLKDDRVALSYGKQRGNHLNKFSEHRIFRKWFPDKSVCPQKSYFCNNANCAVRRSDWERRPYNEMLSGLEDLAWAKEAQAAGGWIAYVAEAEIVHVHEESWDHVRNRYRREAIAMKTINPHLSFSLLDFFRLFFRNTVSDYRSASRRSMVFQELFSIPLFRFNQFWGTYRGHNGPCEVTAELKQRFYFPPPVPHAYEENISMSTEQINYDQLIAQQNRT